MMSHDFQFDDLGTFSDTRYCILLHMHLHDPQPIDLPSVRHHLPAGLVLAAKQVSDVLLYLLLHQHEQGPGKKVVQTATKFETLTKLVTKACDPMKPTLENSLDTNRNNHGDSFD